MQWLIATIILLTMLMASGRADQPSSFKPLIRSAPHYDIMARILPEARRLEVNGTVWLPASDAVRHEIRLELAEQLRDFRIEVVEPTASAGAARTEQDAADHAQRIIHPLHAVPAGAPVLLRFSYAGGDKFAPLFDFSADSSIAAGVATAWYPREDRSRSTGVLRFSVPSGYAVVASGSRINAPSEAAQGSFRFAVEQPMLFSFAIGKYTVVRRSGAVPISAYLLHPRQNIESYLKGCSEIIDFLSRQFGPYRFREFTLIEVPAEQAAKSGFSGASVAGFIYVSSAYLAQEFDRFYFAHEIGHQWWPSVVGQSGAQGSYMLDEAMAQFGALLTIEALEGTAAAEHYRRGSSDQGGFAYLLRAATGTDQPLSDLSKAGEDAHDLALSKGYVVLDLLSRTVGREQFRHVLRDITQRYAFRRITWDEFLHAVEAGSGRDLGWFYAQWFERTGAPDWQLAWKQEGESLRGVITQSAPYYRVTLEVLAEGDDYNRFVREVEVSGARTEFTLPVKFRARAVVLDPHYEVLRWTPEYRAEVAAVAPAVRAMEKSFQGNHAEAERELQAILGQGATPDLYAARFFAEYALARVFMNQGRWREAKLHLEASLTSPTRRADTLPWVYFFLAQAAKELGDDATLRWAVDAAIAADAVAGGRTGAAGAARALL
jgi:Peptidase family M1 domain